MSGVRPEWRGTQQHRGASDLSRWLVHLTRSEADLISILKDGVIEAQLPWGAGRNGPASDAHRSVCLTETPLHELARMTERRPWGVVFDKERLRAKFGAQPVWYVSEPSNEWDAVEAAMHSAWNDPASPFWLLTPFIERVRPLGSGSPNDWRWEREWRVRGRIEFELADIAMLVADDQGAPSFFEEISVGVPWLSRDDSTIRWSGGFFDAWENEIDSMLERFEQQFLTPDAAGMPWDNEDKAYFPIVEILDTWDAMEEAFGHLAPEVHEAILHALNGTSTLWCRIYDLSQAYE